MKFPKHAALCPSCGKMEAPRKNKNYTDRYYYCCKNCGQEWLVRYEPKFTLL